MKSCWNNDENVTNNIDNNVDYDMYNDIEYNVNDSNDNVDNIHNNNNNNNSNNNNNNNNNNDDNNNNNVNNNNSPGLRPIGLLDLQLSPGRCVFVSRRRKVGAPGPSAAKVGPTWSPLSFPDDGGAHFDCIFSMDPNDAISIDP